MSVRDGRPPARRAVRGSAAVAGLLAGLMTAVACSPAATESAPTRDLELLRAMLRLEGAHEAIQPHLRSLDKMDEIARLGDEIAQMAASPLFVEWPQQPGFPHAPGRYERFRVDLEEGAREAAAAARARDLSALHQAYARMNASCTACHKRYSPTY